MANQDDMFGMPAGDPVSGYRTIQEFDTYAEAEEAVDTLSDAGFPVEQTRIIGVGVRVVERVTGRRGYGKAALDGALNGAIIGALVGLLLGLFSVVDPLVNGLVLALWGVLIGTVLGALIALGTHATTGGRRDFGSVTSLEAERFRLDVAVDQAEEAERQLARQAG